MPLEAKFYPNKYFNLLLITAFWAVQGCAMAAPAALSYGVSTLGTAKTESTQPAPQELRTYPEYVTAMERINTEREKAGLKRRPIMTQEEWVCAQKAGSTAATPAPAPTTTAAAPAAETAAPPPAPTATAAAPAPAPAGTSAAAPTPAPATPAPAASEKTSETK